MCRLLLQFVGTGQPVFFILRLSKKDIRDLVKGAMRLGLEDIDSIDNIIQKRTKTLMLQMIHDSDHFINNFLEQCPSGRYRHVKYRSSWGWDSFLRSMSIKLNEFFNYYYLFSMYIILVSINARFSLNISKVLQPIFRNTA